MTTWIVLCLLAQSIPDSIRQRSDALESLGKSAEIERDAQASRHAQEIEGIRQDRIASIDNLVAHLVKMKRALSGPVADYGDAKKYRKLREAFERANGIR